LQASAASSAFFENAGSPSTSDDNPQRNR
jgi:hypothetical protein